ncbi:MAG: site-specific DNA-methyltransferase, partial [Bacteroidaceae bacterium]|nr:site-specific DNA-methyltransferase [Bacteroidaceae bacterium]
ARKKEKVPHYYNYELMKHINGDTQMTDVWRLPVIAPWEKTCTKHPTQKPLGLLSRIIMASTEPGAWVLDPFAGSSTTGIAANLLGRRFLGIEQDEGFANISKARREEIEDIKTFATYKRKIPDIVKAEDTQTDIFTCNEHIIERLPFLEDDSVESKDDVLMYAVGSSCRQKTEPIGQLALGIKDGALDNVNINNIGYIMFHYWNNEKATPYKLLNTPRLVSKLYIPSGYLLRMGKGAEEFLLLDYDPRKPAEIENFNIKKVMRKGKGRYLPFVASMSDIKT